MLTTEKRQAIQSLISNPNIDAVQISDTKFQSGIESNITIFAIYGADHYETLRTIAIITGAKFKKQPMGSGDLSTIYELYIDGICSCISGIYFNEKKKKIPVDPEIQEKLLQDYSNIDWTADEILRSKV